MALIPDVQKFVDADPVILVFLHSVKKLVSQMSIELETSLC